MAEVGKVVMSDGARLDYFRSEIKGEIEKLHKRLDADRKVTMAELRALSDRIEQVLRKVQAVESSL